MSKGNWSRLFPVRTADSKTITRINKSYSDVAHLIGLGEILSNKLKLTHKDGLHGTASGMLR